jgi:thimet oligopeptidase
MLYDYGQVSPERVTAETDDAIAAAEELIARAADSAETPTFETTLWPIELAGASIAVGYGRGAFMGQVHPDADVRDVAQRAEERINKWRVGLPFREDLYRAVRGFAGTEEAAALAGERRRLLEHWLRDFRRAGQELEAEPRAELQKLRDRLVEMEVAFQRNVNEYDDGIEITREELEGLPEDYLERLSPGKQPGTLRVSLDYPELNPFLDQARHRHLREQLFRKHWHRAVDANRPLLTEALRIRHRMAELLGYPTWAHAAMELKMAGEPGRVRRELYDRLLPPVAEARSRELAELGEMLDADGESGTVQAWDWRYYDEQMRRQRYGVDQSKVAEYLPLDQVWRGLFELTGEVFGLTYRPMQDVPTWHPSVQVYEIGDRKSGKPLGLVYVDLFPRDGKYGHAAAFPLVVGHRRADGEYERPVSALVANFTPPSDERPSLLRHGELETLFHEWGHILHMTVTRAEFARFSGAETEWDFVEAPSQIMEHWIWDASVLRRFAKHYRTGEPIPDGLVEQLVAARNLNIGIRVAVQAYYGTMDLALHDGEPQPDLDAICRSAYAVTGMPYPEGTFMPSGFGHLMGGYDAGYYGYLWAEVIGDDMFGRFVSEGITSPEVGMAYRRTVLEPGGSRSADDLVRDFLGRDPSAEAFLRLRNMLPGEPSR